MATSTDLIVPGDGDDKGYAVLQMQPAELSDLITGNLAPGETIGVRDLPRIKIPSAGFTKWTIPSIEGEQIEGELRGILIHVGNRRVYWQKTYEETGGGEPPDCKSNDGLNGIAMTDDGPGGNCLACPLNQFPEPDANGFTGSKPCKEIRQLFLLPVDGILPMVINVTPGSLANAKEYFMGLLNVRKQRTDVETIMTLDKVKPGRYEYSQVVFRKGRDLDQDAVKHMRAYSSLIGPYLADVGVDQGDVEGQVAA